MVDYSRLVKGKRPKKELSRIKELQVIRSGFDKYHELWDIRGYNIYEYITPGDEGSWPSLDYYPYWAMNTQYFERVNKWFIKKIVPLLKLIAGLIPESDSLWAILRSRNEKAIKKTFIQLKKEWRRRPRVGDYPKNTKAISPYEEIGF